MTENKKFELIKSIDLRHLVPKVDQHTIEFLKTLSNEEYMMMKELKEVADED